MTLKKVTICLFVYALFFAGCSDRRGPAQRAGERSDEIIDNVKDGRNPLHKKGALEKAGDSIDETLGTKNR